MDRCCYVFEPEANALDAFDGSDQSRSLRNNDLSGKADRCNDCSLYAIAGVRDARTGGI